MRRRQLDFDSLCRVCSVLAPRQKQCQKVRDAARRVSPRLAFPDGPTCPFRILSCCLHCRLETLSILPNRQVAGSLAVVIGRQCTMLHHDAPPPCFSVCLYRDGQFLAGPWGALVSAGAQSQLHSQFTWDTRMQLPADGSRLPFVPAAP